MRVFNSKPARASESKRWRATGGIRADIRAALLVAVSARGICKRVLTLERNGHVLAARFPALFALLPRQGIFIEATCDLLPRGRGRRWCLVLRRSE